MSEVKGLPAGSQYKISHAYTIDLSFIQSQSGDIQTSRGDIRSNGEGLSEIDKSLGAIDFCFTICRN